MRRKTKEEFEIELDELDNGIILVGEYINNKTKTDFMCSRGHLFPSYPLSILRGVGCPFCAGRLPIVGETDLWTTRPDVAALLKNPDNGYKYSYGSHTKVDFICPNCESIHHKEIKTVCHQGIGCQYCSDGVSYPNKFIRQVLKCIDVENLCPEWSPEWIGRYHYDVYFEKDGHSYIVEMDGGLGHGGRDLRTIDRLCGNEVDEIKDVAAKEHNITLIRIDSDYGILANRYNFIKNSIINSELSNIINLDCVDWEDCNAMALSSFVVRAAEMFQCGHTTTDIAEYFQCSTNAVRHWLYQAEELGLCNCDPIRRVKRGSRPYKQPVNQYSMNGEFICAYESLSEVERQTGICAENIGACCQHKVKSSHGYIWFYATDPDQPDKTKILNTTK